jgi:hypothetical protein
MINDSSVNQATQMMVCLNYREAVKDLSPGFKPWVTNILASPPCKGGGNAPLTLGTGPLGRIALHTVTQGLSPGLRSLTASQFNPFDLRRMV